MQNLNFLLHHSNLNLTYTSESKSCPCSVPPGPLPPFLQDEPNLFNKRLMLAGLPGGEVSIPPQSCRISLFSLLFLLYKEKKACSTPHPHLITI